MLTAKQCIEQADLILQNSIDHILNNKVQTAADAELVLGMANTVRALQEQARILRADPGITRD